MIKPVNNHVIVQADEPEEEKDGFYVGNTNKYTRLNRGVITETSSKDWEIGTKVYYQDFQGVEIDKNIIVLHVDDIVAYKDKVKGA